MRVLVTGGAGFIGSHLVDRLVTDGHEVRVLDDLSSGKLANLADAGRRLEFVRGDIADAELVASTMRGCDAVVHLAAVASVEASVQRPLSTNRTNLVGTITVLEAAAAAGAKRVVYASSAAVYGEAVSLPIGEDTELRPRSPYAADKLAGEHYLAHYQRLGLLSGTAFRFFNVYGPRQDPGSPYSGVISIFLDAVANGRKVCIHGDGSQTRDFVFVADVVEAIVRSLADRQAGGPAGAGGELPVLNLGRGVATDLNELLATIAAVCGREGRVGVEHGPRRHGDIPHSLADIGRLRERLGWQPGTALREGLAATAGSVRAQ